MSRLIPITDPKKRDAQVSADWPKKPPAVRFVGPGGTAVHLEKLIKSTDTTSHEALSRRFGTPEALARALVEGDPEIDPQQVGRPLRNAGQVFVRADGTVLYTARVLQAVFAPDGSEKSRQDFVDVEATVSEDGQPLIWTGKLMPLADVARRFAFVRKLQLRHVSGLTFDFLFEIAKTLHDSGKLLLVGAGPKGALPLILSTNGSPYRGFLEGRVEGEKYLLVLHLSNLELKSVAAPAAGA